LTTNVPVNAGRDVRHAQADEVAVLVEVFVVADREGPRRCRALREDNNEHRPGDTDQARGVMQPQRWHGEVRQAAGYGREHGHVVPGQVRQAAHQDRYHHDDQRAGHSRGQSAGG